MVRVFRDDRVATLEMDYNADKPFGQFWTMSGSPDDDAGFLVIWWPQNATTTVAMSKVQILAKVDPDGLCLSPNSPLLLALNEKKKAESTSTTAKLSSFASLALKKLGWAASSLVPSATAALPTGLPPGAKWLVTGNRRVQLQPLDNNVAYQVRVQRLSARGKINSQATLVTFDGG